MWCNAAGGLFVALVPEHPTGKAAGLRQVDMAKRLGKPQAFVSYYESGARRLDLLELREICGILGIPLVFFVRRFEKS